MNNLITNSTAQSYNTAVNTINKEQKSNIARLTTALSEVSSSIAALNSSLKGIVDRVSSLREKIYINQALIDNVDRSTYVFPEV